MPDHHKTFLGDFKRFFGRGLAILLPSVLTLWILFQLFMFLMNNVGDPINRGVRYAVIQITPRVLDDDEFPKWFQVSDAEIMRARSAGMIRGIDDMEDDELRSILREDKFRAWWKDTPGMDLIGLVIAIIVIYFAGVLLGGYLGRGLYTRIERFMERVPGFKQVYPHVKRVVEMVLGDTPIAFNRVILVQYPREGIWTVALVTSSSMKAIHKAGGGTMLSVFVPSTPTPFTGFTINVRESEVIDLPVSVEEAVRFFITGGVLVPDSQLPEGAKSLEAQEAAARAMAQIRGTAEGDSGPETAEDAGGERPV